MKRAKYQLPLKGIDKLVGWLVVLGLTVFETVFQSILGRLPERGRKKSWTREKNVQTAPARTNSNHSRPLRYSLPN